MVARIMGIWAIVLLWHKDQISRWLSWKRYSERLIWLHDITAPLEQSSLPHLGFISQKWFTLQPLLDYSLCKLQNHSPNRQCQDPCFVYYLTNCSYTVTFSRKTKRIFRWVLWLHGLKYCTGELVRLMCALQMVSNIQASSVWGPEVQQHSSLYTPICNRDSLSS